MTTGIKVLVGFLIVTVVGITALGVSALGYFSSVKNTCVKYENTIISYNAAMENKSSETWKTVQGMAKVNEKYTNSLKELVTGYTQGRKLSNDAMFAAVNEAIPNLDQSTFTRIMDAMDAGYKGFADLQNRKIEEVKNYKIWMEQSLFLRQTAMGVLNYPKIDLVKESEVISTKEAKEIMESGEDKGVDI